MGAALGGLLLTFLSAQAVFGCVAVGFVGCVVFVIWTGLRKM
jgi:hypothetical protein